MFDFSFLSMQQCLSEKRELAQSIYFIFLIFFIFVFPCNVFVCYKGLLHGGRFFLRPRVPLIEPSPQQLSLFFSSCSFLLFLLSSLSPLSSRPSVPSPSRPCHPPITLVVVVVVIFVLLLFCWASLLQMIIQMSRPFANHHPDGLAF